MVFAPGASPVILAAAGIQSPFDEESCLPARCMPCFEFAGFSNRVDGEKWVWIPAAAKMPGHDEKALDP